MGLLFRFKQVILVALLTASPIFARAGSVDGGSDGVGGDVEPATRADIEELVASWRRFVADNSDYYLYGGSFQVTSGKLKPEVARVVKGVMGTEYFSINKELGEYLEQLKFEIVDGPCSDGGVNSDASTQFKKGAAICLSAQRLSRIPKSSLRQALLPLVLHEVAHQFGFQEAEAGLLQKLATIHLSYREVYLESLRAWGHCGLLAKENLTAKQKAELLEFWKKFGEPGQSNLPELDEKSKNQARMNCSARATSAAESLKRLFNGDLWQPLEPTALTFEEKLILTAYNRYDKFAFLTITKALKEPSYSGYFSCEVCKERGLDPAYIMMLGAKAALWYTDYQVGRLQDIIAAKK